MIVQLNTSSYASWWSLSHLTYSTFNIVYTYVSLTLWQKHKKATSNDEMELLPGNSHPFELVYWLSVNCIVQGQRLSNFSCASDRLKTHCDFHFADGSVSTFLHPLSGKIKSCVGALQCMATYRVVDLQRNWHLQLLMKVSCTKTLIVRCSRYVALRLIARRVWGTAHMEMMSCSPSANHSL